MFHICRKLAQTWFINDWQKGLPRSGGEVHPSCVSNYFTLFLAIVIVPPTSLCASADAPPPPETQSFKWDEVQESPLSCPLGKTSVK